MLLEIFDVVCHAGPLEIRGDRFEFDRVADDLGRLELLLAARRSCVAGDRTIVALVVSHGAPRVGQCDDVWNGSGDVKEEEAK